MEEVKTDLVSEKEVTAELGLDYDPPCSTLTYKCDILNANKQILERRMKQSIQTNIIKASESIN